MTDTLLANATRLRAGLALRLRARPAARAPADGVRRVTCVDKANVLRSLYFFREIFLEIAQEYPDIEAECCYVDATAQALVIEPEHFCVIVTENLFGDILSDLGGGTAGGIALCGSGNIGDGPAYFEPIHGSAPSIAGRGLANPIGQLLSAAADARAPRRGASGRRAASVGGRGARHRSAAGRDQRLGPRRRRTGRRGGHRGARLSITTRRRSGPRARAASGARCVVGAHVGYNPVALRLQESTVIP